MERDKKMPKEITNTWKWVHLGRRTEVGRGGEGDTVFFIRSLLEPSDLQNYINLLFSFKKIKINSKTNF